MADRIPSSPEPTSSLAPGLYIVATPIGNLGDISARAAAVLGAASLIAAEDTRVTGKLLHHLGLKVPMTPYHDHSDDAVRRRLLDRAAVAPVALVSDAGTPLISDPGYRLVLDARAAGIAVTTVPGPSALIAALTLAGLPTDRFYFGGFLPNKAKARSDAIAAVAAIDATLVFCESGPRLAAALAALADGLGAERPAAVARELTKLHEECVTGTLTDLAARYTDAPPKGEIVLVIGGPPAMQAEVADAATVDAALTAALADQPVAQAAKVVAKRFGQDRADIYARALQLREAMQGRA